MIVDIEFRGMGLTESSPLTRIKERTILPYQIPGWRMFGVNSTGVYWIGVTALSTVASVRIGSRDPECVMVHHSQDGSAEGRRVMRVIGSGEEQRTLAEDHRVLQPGEMITVGRPGQEQIIFTGRVIR